VHSAAGQFIGNRETDHTAANNQYVVHASSLFLPSVLAAANARSMAPASDA
jgi:hypothetical protein